MLLQTLTSAAARYQGEQHLKTSLWGKNAQTIVTLLFLERKTELTTQTVIKQSKGLMLADLIQDA